MIERTVSGMGYDLVDVEIAGRGLLRVFIDLPAQAYAAQPPQADVAAGGNPGVPLSVRVEDCERVSHQLSHVLTVENVDYDRLEVSSPGMDRPLKRRTDYERFVGAAVALRLRQPLSGRRNFEGVLLRDEADAERWHLELVERAAAQPGKAGVRRVGPKAAGAKAGKGAQEGKGVKPGPSATAAAGAAADTQPGSRTAEPAASGNPASAGVAASDAGPEAQKVRRLTFTLDEIERARLVPVVKF